MSVTNSNIITLTASDIALKSTGSPHNSALLSYRQKEVEPTANHLDPEASSSLSKMYHHVLAM